MSLPFKQSHKILFLEISLCFVAILLAFIAMPLHWLLNEGWGAATFDKIHRYLNTFFSAFPEWLTIYAKWLRSRQAMLPWLPMVLMVTILLSILIRRSTSHPLGEKEGRFAAGRDIRSMQLWRGSWMVLGRFHGKYLRLPETLSVLCVAPPGTGKTAGIVIPTILRSKPCSMIINDVKPELVRLTSGARARATCVWVLAFGEADQGEKGILYAKWNPLSPQNMPVHSAKRDLYLERLTHILIEEKGEGNAAYFQSKARNLLTGLFLWLLERYAHGALKEEPTIAYLQDWLSEALQLAGKQAVDPIAFVFTQIIHEATHHHYHRRIAIELTECLSAAREERGSILSTMFEGISIFKNAAVRERTMSSDFSFAEVRGVKDARGKWQPVTLYLSMQQQNAKALGKITALFCEALSGYLLAHPPLSYDEQGRMLGPYPVMFILDEFPQMPKMQAVLEGTAVGRGQKLAYLLIGQDLAQIEEKYGTAGVETLLSTTAVKLVLPLNNDKTAKRFSDMVGETTIHATSYSKQSQAWLTHQITSQETQVAFLPCSYWMSLPKGKHIVLYQHHMQRPILANTPFYFRDRRMRKSTLLPPVFSPAHSSNLSKGAYVMKHILAIGAMIASFFGACTALAEAPNTSPPNLPYSDVWGYTLSAYPALQRSDASDAEVSAYYLDDGDIAFVFKANEAAENYALITFFAGEKKLLTDAELNAFDAIHRDRTVDGMSAYLVHFPDGTSYKNVYAGSASICESHLANYVAVLDKEQKEIDGWMFLYKAESHMKEPEFCTLEAGEIVLTNVRVKAATFMLIPLQDGTFIGVNRQMLVRFKKDFSTPFAPFNKRFRVIKKSAFTKLVAGAKNKDEEQERVAAWLTSHPAP